MKPPSPLPLPPPLHLQQLQQHRRQVAGSRQHIFGQQSLEQRQSTHS